MSVRDFWIVFLFDCDGNPIPLRDIHASKEDAEAELAELGMDGKVIELDRKTIARLMIGE